MTAEIIQFIPKGYDPRRNPQRQHILESDLSYAQRVASEALNGDTATFFGADGCGGSAAGRLSSLGSCGPCETRTLKISDLPQLDTAPSEYYAPDQDSA